MCSPPFLRLLTLIQFQFHVTPPKTGGPSEAERKLEALTKQLEEEMEKEEESGEFFGELNFTSASKK